MLFRNMRASYVEQRLLVKSTRMKDLRKEQSARLVSWSPSIRPSEQSKSRFFVSNEFNLKDGVAME